MKNQAYTPDQLLEYTRYELKEEEIETRIYDAKIEGREEGREKAEAKAYQEKIESAKQMLKDNLPMDLVAKYSGLSPEEIRKLT